VEWNGNFGELWLEPGQTEADSSATIAGRNREALFHNELLYSALVRRRAEAKGFLATYPRSPHYHRFAELGNHTRLLIFAGTADSAVPILTARRTAAAYSRSAPPGHVQLLEFEGSTHTPMGNPDGHFCAWQILVAFLVSPGLAADYTPCAPNFPPHLDFAGEGNATRALARTYLGTTDLWGSPPVVTPTPAPAPARSACDAATGVCKASTSGATFPTKKECDASCHKAPTPTTPTPAPPRAGDRSGHGLHHSSGAAVGVGVGSALLFGCSWFYVRRNYVRRGVRRGALTDPLADPLNTYLELSGGGSEGSGGSRASLSHTELLLT
jgi:hypothetical protein